ncbi:MAG: response regulator [Planctomycetaceae bacterium]|nr:response regulator [Planctomycetaceae bacterium]
MTIPDNDPFTGAQILAVDDDEVKRYSWQRILTRAGFDVVIASTGGEALQRSKDNPALIILDVRLPDISGTEVCRKLKASASTSSIPVLHISASLITPEDRTAALEGGADGYLTEPVDPEELVASVKALLRMRRAEEEARRSAEAWKTTFDTIQDGIVVVNGEGRVSRSNRAFLTLCNCTEEEVLDADLKTLLTRKMQITGLEDFGPMAQSRVRRTAEISWQNRWYRVAFDPLLDGPEVAGGICILVDVTERKAAETKVHQLNSSLEERVTERTERLEAAIRELEAYSYTIAHDLRAPLRAIHRFSEILLDEYGAAIDAQGQDYAKRIVAGAEKMDTLISGLLEYSRLTRSDYASQPLPSGEIVAEVLRTLADSSSTRIPEIVVDQPLPEVVGDRLLLQQIFQNLISNALKFVAPGVRPRVRVSGAQEGDRVTFSIADNGLGIPPESQGRLFRVFERLDNALDFPGTGIGLAIVRRAVERMGGEYGVASEIGKGSRFWFRLPAVHPKKGGTP